MPSPSVLIATTFKDNYRLMPPFYRFYREVWKDPSFVFFCGLSDRSMKSGKLIDDVKALTGRNLDVGQLLDVVPMKDAHLASRIHELIHGLTLFHDRDKKVFLVIYGTPRDYPPKVWDRFVRPALFDTVVKHLPAFEINVNVDNDEFLFVPDLDAVTKNVDPSLGAVRFHTFEFIPREGFSLEQDFAFSNFSFYFCGPVRKARMEGTVQEHAFCRDLYPFDIRRHCDHTERTCRTTWEHLESRTYRVESPEDLDRQCICFSFSCLDLDYLLNNKHWIQSFARNKPRFRVSDQKVIKHFKRYYEDFDQPLIVVNWMKKFFRP